ncbi:outer membrane protein [Xanthobacteraceae bacterium A53D]
MKKILLCATALALLTAPAAAADLARAYPVKAVVPVVPVFSWTGFYVGANAGYGWADFDSDITGIAPKGWFAGLQAGYNYQFANNVVLGIETDITWGDIKADELFPANLITPLQTYSSSIDYYGTIRARLGYAFDRWLPYITGGAAYARQSVNVAAFDPGFGIVAGSDAQNHWGWVIGGGVEYAITNNVTAKIEYQYADLGTQTYTPPGFLPNDNSLTLQTLRLGVNWKF